MSQISRRFLQQKTEDRIITLFTDSILLCDTREKSVSFINDLLTPTEKVMLSKRFSIAFMLLEKYDYNTISQILKVSRATIGKVSNWLKEKGDGFREVVDRLKQKDFTREVISEIQDIIEEFIASTRGQNWSRSKKALWQSRHDKIKPF
ncbi:hypothetical protein A3D03_03305 [Candidatus Gottesmanbacteria bacterium RIFCSPHIGHO2_02_FULL_40_13]|uniref:TrpR like protein, YerC/YecD n=1 Tax=Candidatus Gottesmanbacteria bacterium RIFCSPHIGHO2_02_FULL_40_13 TaxID=1798384 RepID=A0A1F6A5K3_9BACT|nr:MAG: hypothetical protein A3D03_03305 [Candidatus Gottesmanbacteria bacterium RIFCSPHIGHO2_02_FULL_40_13]